MIFVSWVVIQFQRHWRIMLTIAGLILLLATVLFIFKACSSQPKINEKEIFEAQTAIAERDDKKLREILTNVEAREKQIDNVLQNANDVAAQAKVDAKKKYDKMNAAELQAEFERRANQ